MQELKNYCINKHEYTKQPGAKGYSFIQCYHPYRLKTDGFHRPESWHYLHQLISHICVKVSINLCRRFRSDSDSETFISVASIGFQPFSRVNPISEISTGVRPFIQNTKSPGFYSHLYLVPKKTGGWRPVTDLSILNRNLVIPRFHMETTQSIRQSLFPGAWVTSIYLKEAYFIYQSISPPGSTSG